MLIMKRPRFLSIVLLLLIELCFALASPLDSSLQMLSCMSVIALLLSIGILCKTHGLSAMTIFAISLAVMHCGQIAILAVDGAFPRALRTSVAIGEGYVYSAEAIRYVTHACLITNIWVACFEKASTKSEGIRCEQKMSLTSVGWCFVVGVFLLSCLSDLVKAIQVAALGYGGGYKQANTLLFYMDLLYPLVLFLTIAIYADDIRYIKAVFWINIVKSVFSMLVIGSRGKVALSIIIMTYLILRMTNNPNVKRYIRKYLILIGIGGIIVLPFSGLLRVNTSLSFSEFIREVNPISYSLTEFGGTIVNITLAIPNMKALNTSEFFTAFLTIIPAANLFVGSGVSAYGANYANYLNTVGGRQLGGSIIGEGLFWFGEAGGIIYLLIVATVAILVLNRINGKQTKMGITSTVCSLYLFYNICLHIRGAIVDTATGIKLMIYFYVLFLLVGKYLIKVSYSQTQA